MADTVLANRFKLKSTLRSFGPLLGFVGIVVVFSILTGGKIVQPKNLSLMLSQVFVLMIASTGVFFVMTVGGLDFSQGSILGLASIIFCWVSQLTFISRSLIPSLPRFLRNSSIPSASSSRPVW